MRMRIELSGSLWEMETESWIDCCAVLCCVCVCGRIERIGWVLVLVVG